MLIDALATNEMRSSLVQPMYSMNAAVRINRHDTIVTLIQGTAGLVRNRFG